MKERWILTGKFMNGDKYMESFDTIFDMTDVIEEIYTDWMTANGLDDYQPQATKYPEGLQL